MTYQVYSQTLAVSLLPQIIQEDPGTNATVLLYYCWEMLFSVLVHVCWNSS